MGFVGAECRGLCGGGGVGCAHLGKGVAEEDGLGRCRLLGLVLEPVHAGRAGGRGGVEGVGGLAPAAAGEAPLEPLFLVWNHDLGRGRVVVVGKVRQSGGPRKVWQVRGGGRGI